MIAVSLALALAAPLDLYPGARYDAGVPTLGQSAGHDFGEKISSPEEIVAYLRALAAAASDRTRLVRYGETWEGRPLYVMLVASRERIAKLDEVKAGLARLANPRGLDGPEGDRLTRELPVVTWLQHAVHGDEVSSSDAALAEAYHLLAAREDPVVDRILADSLVIIDPLENPDGRSRFLATNGAAQAPEPDPEPLAAEHDQPWPGGRYNHYLFDMNRDWFALSQVETRGRVKLMLDWPPQVVVDLHEMGGNLSYYFAPPATPLNPHVTPRQQEWLETFGRANAARFDERGFAYFIRETYDSFYPGYGESWPIFNGAVGMTYEQASPRGLVWRRPDDMLLSYRDAVVHHFTAALATLDTAAKNRERLLRDFLDYRRGAVAEGERGPVREYLIPPGEDPPRAERLARLLGAQGIEVFRAEEAVPYKGRNLPAGTFIVPLAQPSGRLARNLLDPQTALDEKFLKEQDRRRRKRMPDQFYDLTGWSLPLAFDVDCLPAEAPAHVRASALGPRPEAPSALPPAKVGYLLPWGSEMAPAVAEALRAGLRIRVLARPFTQSGRRFGAGTALVRSADNAPDAREILGSILSRRGLAAVATDSGWVDEGISLGSSEGASLKAPRVVLAWDTPTETLSAGWARYVLERRFEQPVTVVRVASLARLDLRRFDVMVLPSGDYEDALEDGASRIKEWVRAGGTLVTLGNASRWAVRDKVGLLDTTAELRDGRPDVEPSDKEKEEERKKDAKAAEGKPFDLTEALRPDREPPESTPGALVRASLDRDHWLSAGSDGEIQVVVEGSRVFTPIKLDKGTNVGLYAPLDRLVASGHAWQEARSLLAQKAFLIEEPLGNGHVVAFAEDPNYRAFSEATELLFLNAVLLGPAF
jgi:hypothetical protein